MEVKRVLINTNKILRQLRKTCAPIDKLSLPAKAGVYAIFLKKGLKIPPDNASTNDIVYIGKSNNLSSREYATHFSSNGSGFSTLRRSIGALLKNNLQLVAIPRGSSSSPSNYRCYRFTKEGEERLTVWMKDNLEIGICPLGEDCGEIEKRLILGLKPILCLKGWNNPFSQYIINLRKKCTQEAYLNIREARRETGT